MFWRWVFRCVVYNMHYGFSSIYIQIFGQSTGIGCPAALLRRTIVESAVVIGLGLLLCYVLGR